MKLTLKIFPVVLFVFAAGCSPAVESEPMKTPAITPSPEIISGAGNADVAYVRAEEKPNGSWTITVTVSHPDTGWEDYADGWDVVLEDGTVLKPDQESPFTGLLQHPHVDEQPFTRSQSGIIVPEGERYLIIRAHDLVDGFGGQSVVVDLFVPSGKSFEVVREIYPEFGVQGFTNHNLDGNRYLTGQIDLPNAKQLDIPLSGTPEWVVGVPLLDGGAIWLVALQDGGLQAFKVGEGGYAGLGLPYSNLTTGEPPAIRSTETGFELLNQQVDHASDSTHPITIDPDQLVYISDQGALTLKSGDQTSILAENVLPDGRILQDETGGLLLLSDPTTEYAHGVLGDSLEADSITMISGPVNSRELRTIEAPAGWVIEGIAPIWADLDSDGVREIIVTLSNDRDGAQLVVYSAEGELLAQGEPIGTGYRWRHQIAAAPFGPKGEIEIVGVLTPHIGGVVEFFRMQGDALVKTGEVGGFTSHVIGTRNLDLALAADVDADGQVELLLPNQQRTSLGAVQRTASGAEVAWEIDLNGQMTTNLGAISFDHGVLSLAVGLDSGVLRVWLP